MKTRKDLRRPHRVKCFLSDEELQRVTTLRQQLGATMSDLIRSRLLHPDMLNINPAKLLLIFSEIGSDLASINAMLKKYFMHPENFENGAHQEAISKLAGEYIIAQGRLEMQIRKLLIKIKMRN